VPVDRQAQRVLHLDDAGSGEARRRTGHRARVRRDAVDVVGREPRVRDGRERGLDRQVHVGAEEAPADLRLRHAGDDRAPFDPLGLVDATGRTCEHDVSVGHPRALGRSFDLGERRVVRLEDRERDFLGHLAEVHADRHADRNGLRRDVHEVRREP
jgi:hypothetical protein